jgi:hypothetical protein
MNKYFRQGTIKRKIMLITLVTSGMALLLLALSSVTNQIYSYQKQSRKNVSIVADMIGFSCTAPLMFSDVKAASEALASLKAKPRCHRRVRSQ